MKHGPNALIDENLPVVVLATRDPSRREPRPLRKDALQHSGSEGARRHRGGGGLRGRRRGRQGGRPRHRDPAIARAAAADSRGRSSATAGLSHRRAPRLRRGSAPQSGQERHRRVGRYAKTQIPGSDPTTLMSGKLNISLVAGRVLHQALYRGMALAVPQGLGNSRASAPGLLFRGVARFRIRPAPPCAPRQASSAQLTRQGLNVANLPERRLGGFPPGSDPTTWRRQTSQVDSCTRDRWNESLSPFIGGGSPDRREGRPQLAPGFFAAGSRIAALRLAHPRRRPTLGLPFSTSFQGRWRHVPNRRMSGLRSSPTRGSPRRHSLPSVRREISRPRSLQALRTGPPTLPAGMLDVIRSRSCNAK